MFAENRGFYYHQLAGGYHQIAPDPEAARQVDLGADAYDSVTRNRTLLQRLGILATSFVLLHVLSGATVAAPQNLETDTPATGTITDVVPDGMNSMDRGHQLFMQVDPGFVAPAVEAHAACLLAEKAKHPQAAVLSKENRSACATDPQEPTLDTPDHAQASGGGERMLIDDGNQHPFSR